MTRVLLVDDNLFIRTLLREMLEEGGHVVVGEVPDGIEAASTVARLAPDLVILDLVMPRRTGLDTLECLSTAHPSLPVIICSAGLTQSRVVQALHLGARGFITKPFTLASVLDTVTEVIAQGDTAAVPVTMTLPSATHDTGREERRGFPRIQISLPVVLTPSAESRISALTLDISATGLLLTTSPLALGAVVQFALELDPREAPIIGRARALRERACTRQALAFEHISLADHARLAQFIDHVRPARLNER